MLLSNWTERSSWGMQMRERQMTHVVAESSNLNALAPRIPLRPPMNIFLGLPGCSPVGPLRKQRVEQRLQPHLGQMVRPDGMGVTSVGSAGKNFGTVQLLDFVETTKLGALHNEIGYWIQQNAAVHSVHNLSARHVESKGSFVNWENILRNMRLSHFACARVTDKKSFILRIKKSTEELFPRWFYWETT